MADDQRAVDIIKIYAIILNGDYCERQRNYSKKLNKYYWCKKTVCTLADLKKQLSYCFFVGKIIEFCDLNDKLIQVLRSRVVLDKVITNVF